MLRTVGGTAVAVDDVRWVLPHERVFHQIHRKRSHGLQAADASTNVPSSDIRPEQLQELRQDPFAYNGINMTMDRDDEVFREVEAATKSAPGHGVIVDVTTASEGRDLRKLRRLSERLNVSIIASSSIDDTAIAALPPTLPVLEKVERVAKSIETELMFGVGETQAEGPTGIVYQQIRLTQSTLTEADEILIRSLAMIQSNTSVPLYLSFSHDCGAPVTSPEAQTQVLRWIEGVVSQGANPQQIVLCHADLWSEAPDGLAFLRDLGRRGITLSFDLVGMYTVSDVICINPCSSRVNVDIEPPRDSSIARCIGALIQDDGLCERILVSSGIQQRVQFQRHGGGGYAYAMHRFKARLERGHFITETQWQRIVRENPLRYLQWYKPPEAAPIPKHFLKCSICEQYFEPIVGEYFTKFQFIYCGTKCLRKHSKMGFKELK